MSIFYVGIRPLCIWMWGIEYENWNANSIKHDTELVNFGTVTKILSIKASTRANTCIHSIIIKTISGKYKAQIRKWTFKNAFKRGITCHLVTSLMRLLLKAI